MEPSHPDKELFDRIAVDDESAFRDIFHRYNRRLHHTILKMLRSDEEAQEIIQELFLRLWLNRATLTGIDNPGAWLHTIASNLTLDALRKQARKYQTLVPATDTEDIEPQPGAQFELKEVQSLISEAVSKLPASRREIFILSRQQGMSRRQIAERLHISESTVKNQLTSALHFVQDYLNKKGGIYLPSLLILFIR
jgi:RNA polymerase sigma-70 factor (ECF subfamily)